MHYNSLLLVHNKHHKVLLCCANKIHLKVVAKVFTKVFQWSTTVTLETSPTPHDHPLKVSHKMPMILKKSPKAPCLSLGGPP